MNNDTFEVNTHEAQDTQGKVALKYCQKKHIIFNAYLALFIRFKFPVSSFSRVIRPSN